jgi:hypothetical protein
LTLIRNSIYVFVLLLQDSFIKFKTIDNISTNPFNVFFYIASPPSLWLVFFSYDVF